YLSREAAFLFNNLLLVGIAFAVFWGTLFPVLSEAVRGVKITVGPPFFDKVNAPLALGLVFLMGVGPLIAWRRSSPDNLIRAFASPAIFGVLAGIAAFAGGLRQWYVLTALSLAAFVLGSILVEFRRGVSARRHMVHETAPRALVNLVGKNNRRYGGYIIHLGVILAFVGIVASSFFRVEVKKSVKQGQSFQVGPYELEYDGVQATETTHMESLRARVKVYRDGNLLTTMTPAKLFFKRQQQPATTVAIRSTPVHDLYVVLAGIDDDGSRATFQVFLTPLVFWLWAGGLMMAFGTVVTMWPNVRERAAIAAVVRRPGQLETIGEVVPGGD
ncbi:MAG TPA: cytochrome c-type biogenesis CcmF C-terminal domain-containing protein, partial [Candidatus Binataceae bacterium]|nr:cytochrome c-type biogenesis CcmF C-terminal domain-containing protein [Candidatus Binataceae bacterium]